MRLVTIIKKLFSTKDFIEEQLESHPEADIYLLEFIDDFIKKAESNFIDPDNIINLFSTREYSYYFAIMMKAANNNKGYIVSLENQYVYKYDNILYYIAGIYE